MANGQIAATRPIEATRTSDVVVVVLLLFFLLLQARRLVGQMVFLFLFKCTFAFCGLASSGQEEGRGDVGTVALSAAFIQLSSLDPVAREKGYHAGISADT